MASLRVLTEEPDRIVLGKGGANNAGSLIGAIVFGIVACAGLGGLLSDGTALSPVMIVIFLIVGLGLLSRVFTALRSTRVTLDANTHTASRVSTLLFLPTGRQELSFNLVRDVQVTPAPSVGPFNSDAMPIWKTVLHGTNGSTMVLNDRATRAEMDVLAARVGILLNRPVRETSAATASPTPGATPAPAASLDSFIQNIGAFAASFAAGENLYTPPISAYPTTSQPPPPPPAPADRAVEASPYARLSAQMAAQQVAAGASTREANARMVQEQAAAGASTRETNARMDQEQAAANSDVNQASAQMAQAQVATGAGALQTNATRVAQQAAAGASLYQTSAQMAQQQVAAGADVRQTTARMLQQQEAAAANSIAANAEFASQQADAFRSDAGMQALTGAQFLAADLPFAAASARLTVQQLSAEAAMSYAMPPTAMMPQEPVLASFGPVLNLPAFGPLGAGFTEPTPPPEAVEIKEVQVKSTASGDTDVRELLRQGRQQLSMRNFKEAQEFYFRALNVNPADPAAQNDLGVVYFAQNKLQEAERAFRRTIAFDPFTVEGRYNLGLVLNRLGRKGESRETFRVGAQNVGGNAVRYFEDALNGTLQQPMLASPA